VNEKRKRTLTLVVLRISLTLAAIPQQVYPEISGVMASEVEPPFVSTAENNKVALLRA
jgi:hypothetical protein